MTKQHLWEVKKRGGKLPSSARNYLLHLPPGDLHFRFYNHSIRHRATGLDSSESCIRIIECFYTASGKLIHRGLPIVQLAEAFAILADDLPEPPEGTPQTPYQEGFADASRQYHKKIALVADELKLIATYLVNRDMAPGPIRIEPGDPSTDPAETAKA